MPRVRSLATAAALLGLLLAAAAAPAPAAVRAAVSDAPEQRVPGRLDVHTHDADRFVAYGHHGDGAVRILDTKTGKSSAYPLPAGCVVPWGDIAAPGRQALLPCPAQGDGGGVLIDGATGAITKVDAPAGVRFSKGWSTMGRRWMQLDTPSCPSPQDPAGVVPCRVYRNLATGAIDIVGAGVPRDPADAGNLDDPARAAWMPCAPHAVRGVPSPWMAWGRSVIVSTAASGGPATIGRCGSTATLAVSRTTAAPRSLVGGWTAWTQGRATCPATLLSYDLRTATRTRLAGARLGGAGCPQLAVQTRFAAVLAVRDGQFPADLDDFTKAYRLLLVPRP